MLLRLLLCEFDGEPLQELRVSGEHDVATALGCALEVDRVCLVGQNEMGSGQAIEESDALWV